MPANDTRTGVKHSTATSFCLLIILSSTSHCITLLLNISNLFWGIVFLFFFFSFLQFWARCLNSLQLLHNFPLLSSSSSFSLARVCFSLSKLLINELYCCKDIVLHLCKGIEIMLILANYNYIFWDTRSSSSQVPTALLTTTLIIG